MISASDIRPLNATLRPAVTNHVGHVFSVRAPLKIRDVVVLRVAIDVADFWAARRSFKDKSNEPMDQHRSFSAIKSKADEGVARSV